MEITLILIFAFERYETISHCTLICISLNTNNFELLFLRMLTLYKCSFVRCLPTAFAYFPVMCLWSIYEAFLFIFVLNYLSVLDIMNISLQIYFVYWLCLSIAIQVIYLFIHFYCYQVKYVYILYRFWTPVLICKAPLPWLLYWACELLNFQDWYCLIFLHLSLIYIEFKFVCGIN